MVKARAAQSPTPHINFPLIAERTLQYIDNYRHEVIIDDQIILIHNLVTAKNIARYLKFFNEDITPKLSQPVAPRKGEATRTNERFSVYDPTYADALFNNTQLNVIVNELGLDSEHRKPIIGLNPNIRIYRYQPGAFFGPHYDDSVVDSKQGSISAWTLLIYFTEGKFAGGETSFQMRKGQFIAPAIENGMALLHRHGRNCLLHEGLPVRSGIKWVLRSDLMYAR